MNLIARAVRLSTFYFVLVVTCGAIFGSVRVSFLRPTLGALRYAELLEMPLMMFIIWQSARVTIDRLRQEENTTNATAADNDNNDNEEAGNDADSSLGYLGSILIGGLALGWLVGVELAARKVLQGHVYLVGLDALRGSVSVLGPVYGTGSLAVLLYTLMPWWVWLSDERSRRRREKWQIEFDGSAVEEEGTWF